MANIAVLKSWDLFLRKVREYFYQRNFVEVPTPFLVSSPGVETYIDPLAVADTDYFLPTSPEFHLKKALASGLENIFEIKACFRKDLEGPYHRQEFTMLEFYRSAADLEDLKNDVMALCETKECKSLSMQTLFQDYLDFDLRPNTSREDLAALCRNKNIVARKDDSWSDLFQRLWLDGIEDNLPSETLIFVDKFPPKLAALADFDEEGWANRMEVYWRGIELANAYQELRDPIEQAARFAETNQERLALGKQAMPIDQDFLNSLNYLKPCAGIAMGLERLYMAKNNIKDIHQVRAFESVVFR
tara:strand:- start:22789 stop:23694 length:906 start_codon:yes stop_codon:yes gene_type:complete